AMKRPAVDCFTPMSKKERPAILQPDGEHDEGVKWQRDSEDEQREGNVEESLAGTGEAAALARLDGCPERGAGFDFLPLKRFHTWPRSGVIPEDFGPDDAGLFADFSTGSDPQRTNQRRPVIDAAGLI